MLAWRGGRSLVRVVLVSFFVAVLLLYVRLSCAEKHEAKVQALLQRMASHDEQDSQYAAIRLAELGDRRALPKIREILKSGSPGKKHLAVEKVVNIDAPEVSELLLATARDEKEWPLKVSALHALGKFAARPEVEAFLLRSAKVSDDFGILCIQLLGEHGCGVSKAFAEMLDQEGADNWPRKIAIIRALGRIGDAEAVAKLSAVAESPSAQLSKEAKNCLKPEYRRKQITDTSHEGQRPLDEDLFPRGRSFSSLVVGLALAFSDEHNPSKASAAKAAIHTLLPSPDGSRFLEQLKALDTDGEEKVRKAASRALDYCEKLKSGEIGLGSLGSRARPDIPPAHAAELLMHTVVNDTDKKARLAALYALRRFTSLPKVLTFMLERAKAGDDLGSVSIQILGDERAPVSQQLAALFDEQRKESRLKKKYIIGALARIGDEEAVTKLKSIAKTEEAEIAQEAMRVLGTLVP